MMVPHLRLGKPHDNPAKTRQYTVAITIATREVMLRLSGTSLERLVDLHGHPHLRMTFCQYHHIRTDQRHPL